MTRQFFVSSPFVQAPTRWREAFPEGEVAGLPQLLRIARPADTFWLPGLDPDWACGLRSIRDARPDCPVVVLASVPGTKQASIALDLGARGYCHLLAAPGLLREIAVVVTHGGLWIGPELMARLILASNRGLPAVAEPELVAILSEREREVVRAVARGLTNKEVAARLGITERTVKAHLGSVFEKLGVRDRLQLVLRLSSDRQPVAAD